jgi:hypothetical protein
MLCIKKNKCFVLRKINAFQLCCYYRKKNRQHTVIRPDLLKHVWTCRNTFQSVQICPDPLKHVQTCWNLSKHVSRLPPLPSPFSPLLPLFPFLWGGGGREGEGGGGRGGNTITKNPPEGGGGGRSPPPPPPDFNNNNNKKTKFSHSFFSLLCNLPLPPKGFSQSTAAAAQNYINTYGGGLSTKNKIHSLWHTEMIWNLLYIPP